MRKLTIMSIIASTLAGVASAETSPMTEVAMWQPYDGATIKFDVLRKGKPFGKHIVRFDVDDQGGFTARTDVDLKVKIGPFTAFQYQLDSQEIWQDGRLVALNGKTNDDGDKSFVDAELIGEDLLVDGSAFEGAVRPEIIPSSHWNINQVRSDSMLSTESGEVLDMQIIPKGRETLTIAGQTIETHRYLLDSDIDIDLWYDNAGRWVKLTFEARGQTIEYRLSELF